MQIQKVTNAHLVNMAWYSVQWGKTETGQATFPFFPSAAAQLVAVPPWLALYRPHLTPNQREKSLNFLNMLILHPLYQKLKYVVHTNKCFTQLIKWELAIKSFTDVTDLTVIINITKKQVLRYIFSGFSLSR